MVRKILISLLCLLPVSSFALQVKNASPEETISAQVSAHTLSRIFVKGDRIQHVRGKKGLYQLQYDKKTGAIYIKPMTVYSNKPFNIFITTESGKDYPLFLIPIDTPSETVEIRPKHFNAKKAKHWEEQAPYQTTLLTLIQHMVNESTPPGYQLESPDKDYFWKAKPNLQVKLLNIYQGDRLQGEVAEVRNLSNRSVRIKEEDFYRHGIRAVALKSHLIKPKGVTQLYRVEDDQE